MGTAFMFAMLLAFVIAMMLTEHWLDNFKSH
jgi:hypothetical protein